MNRREFFLKIIAALVGAKHWDKVKNWWNYTVLGKPKWDPILISLVRRGMPNLIAHDLCGVQPMSGPTGLIFTMKHRYHGNDTLYKDEPKVYKPLPKPVYWIKDYQRFSHQIG